MAPGSLCFHEGEAGVHSGLLGGEEGYLQLLYMPSQGTCPRPSLVTAWHP